jgi:WD40 repeat protein
MLASAGYEESKDGKGLMKLWEVRTGKERVTLRGAQTTIYAVAFTPDGKTLTSGGKDGMVRFWDLTTGSEWATLKAHPELVNWLAFSGDGKILASGSADHTVRLWDVSRLLQRKAGQR